MVPRGCEPCACGVYSVAKRLPRPRKSFFGHVPEGAVSLGCHGLKEKHLHSWNMLKGKCCAELAPPAPFELKEGTNRCAAEPSSSVARELATAKRFLTRMQLSELSVNSNRCTFFLANVPVQADIGKTCFDVEGKEWSADFVEGGRELLHMMCIDVCMQAADGTMPLRRGSGEFP